MNREDILRMAKEARLYIQDDESPTNRQDFDLTKHLEHDLTKCLERFASLVAQQEREKIAQMIEDAPKLMDFAKNDKGGCLMCGFTPEIAAQSIRGKWGRHE